MITIKVTGDKDVELLLIEHADEIRDAGIQAIDESFDLDLEEALVAEFDINGEFVDFAIPKKNWLDFVETSIPFLVKDEDYKSLIKVKELIKKITAE